MDLAERESPGGGGMSPIGQEVKAHVSVCGWEVCDTIFARPPEPSGEEEGMSMPAGMAL